ncbi:hypothetical protein [uncultured Umboniibacter sp.]|uniref:hypothetical protein n=1 Tax=uncultured Umboniibacter sp. TaxID=1798917 RepID=UPI002608C320|nr:hypothetical protein [uncultured Umboniibacter sp.]
MATEHEAFNLDRRYGHILRDFKATNCVVSLRNQLKEVLIDKPLMKHCLELMPIDFNIELARVSSELGYNHLFLYRENPESRLLSLFLAQTTGIWGPLQAKKIDIDSKIFDTDIAINKLLDHERSCRNSIRRIHEELKGLNVGVEAVSFENLYESDEDKTTLLRKVFDSLISTDTLIPAELLAGLQPAGQGTKKYYDEFPNYQEFIRQAKLLGTLELE